MPFIAHTPESLLPRSDSKNPASTCCGLTSSGRPCRRAISKPPQSAKSRLLSTRHSTDSLRGPDYFCWQHKDQAVTTSAPPLPQGLQSETIPERTSVDTLVDRLGLLEINSPENQKRQQKQKSEKSQRDRLAHNQVSSKNHAKQKSRSNLTLSCCIGEVDDEYIPPRPTRLQEKPVQKVSTNPSQQKQYTASQNSARPSIKRDPSSKTEQLLSLIPRTATPQVTALLLAELTKPMSAFDEEGYIYMFWLTPESLPSTPPSELAPSLLEVPLDRHRPRPGQRRTSEVLQKFAATSDDSSQKILLKIGRASNVQRRLNEWSRQCGYNLSLIRYYPYHSTSTPNIASLPSKVPHAHKVERLIHIELSGKKAQQNSRCRNCGREHREWFEVEATKNGVKDIDDVIRRWVDWGLQNDS